MRDRFVASTFKGWGLIWGESGPFWWWWWPFLGIHKKKINDRKKTHTQTVGQMSGKMSELFLTPFRVQLMRTVTGARSPLTLTCS